MLTILSSVSFGSFAMSLYTLVVCVLIHRWGKRAVVDVFSKSQCDDAVVVRPLLGFHTAALGDYEGLHFVQRDLVVDFQLAVAQPGTQFVNNERLGLLIREKPNVLRLGVRDLVVDGL